MLYKNKGIPDATVLRLVSKLLRSHQSNKRFRVKTKSAEGTLTYDEVIRFVDELAKRVDDGRYGEIHRCDTCGNFNRSGKLGKRGWCSPKEYTSFRNKTDHCSNWIPMTQEQKQIREKINEHFRTL